MALFLAQMERYTQCRKQVQKDRTMKVTSLDHLVLTVSDIAATMTFYCDVLGMEPQLFEAADGTTRNAVTFGLQKINLHKADAPFAPHADKTMPETADLCLLADSPLDEWITHLNTHNVEVIEGPVARSGPRGKITSIYLRDPDLNLIEVSIYA
jgi:catechol 2,3-dioxygenase-like lactoylglutathione lyase family enzyme